jgi:hypothetical protein
MGYRWILALMGLGVGVGAVQKHLRVTGWEHLRIERRAAHDFAGPRAASLIDPAVDLAGLTPTSTALNRFPTTAGLPGAALPPPPAVAGQTIKLATWHVEPLARAAIASSEVRRRRMELLHQFDVTVVTGLHSITDQQLERLKEELNGNGANYEFLLSPVNGPPGREERMAIVFDSSRIRPVLRQQYSVIDHRNQFSFDPWVIWLESAPSPTAQPWTCTVIAVRLDRERIAQELALLPQLVATVRGDGRQEDDLIMAGHFAAPAPPIDALFRNTGYQCGVREQATELSGERADDNIVLPYAPGAAVEWTGRGGVLDFLRAFNLSSIEAAEVSPHLPVWVEFRAHEA